MNNCFSFDKQQLQVAIQVLSRAIRRKWELHWLALKANDFVNIKNEFPKEMMNINLS